MGNIKAILTYLGEFLIYMLLQVFIFRDLVLFGNAFCFIYILPLILLPMDFPPILLMVLGFFSGLSIDLFYNTPGMHAGAAVLLTFIKPHLAAYISPSTDYEDYYRTNLQNTGFKFFGTLSILLIFIHHFSLLFMEASSLSLFWDVLVKALASTVYTLAIIILIQNLLYLPGRRRRRI